jgi:Protein of unknown function (DUF642)
MRTSSVLRLRWPIVVLLIVLAFVVVLYIVINVPLLRGPELVKNGSFEKGNDQKTALETIIDGPNCKILCNLSDSVFEWTVSGPGKERELCLDGRARDIMCWIVDAAGSTSKVTAAEGNRLVALSGFFGKPASRYGNVSQDIPTKPGQLYELSFAIGSTVKFIDPTSTTRDVEIRVDVAGITKAFPAAQTQEVSHWDTNTMRFTARDQMTTLRLSGEPQPRVGGSGYLGLDNVSVRRLCTLFMVVFSDC